MFDPKEGDEEYVPEVMEFPGALPPFDDVPALEQENIPNPADESRNP